MAVTDDQFAALVKRVEKLEGVTPGPITPLVSVVQLPEAVKVLWTPNLSKTPTKFEVGRDGEDNTGHGPWTGTSVAAGRVTTFDKLVPTFEYTFTVKAFYSDGTTESKSIKAFPLATPTPPAPPQGTTGRGALSSLPFDLTIFNGGDSNLSAMKSFGPRVSVKSFDGILTFTDRGNGWDRGKAWDVLAASAKQVLDAGGIVVWSMPHSFDGDANMNSIGARNGYAKLQQDFGKWLVAKGLNLPNFRIRLDWESNGNWYPWTADAPGGVAALAEACFWFRENVDLAGLDKVKYVACLNIPNDGNEHTWKDMDLNGKVFDYYTIDQYDAWPGVKSKAIWEQKMQSPQSLRNAVRQARAAGKLAGIDEGGSWHTNDGAFDNPIYVDCVVDEILKDVITFACWNIYNDNGAPANLFHGFDANPNTTARIAARLKTLLRK